MKSKTAVVEDQPLPDRAVSKINKIGLVILVFILGAALFLTIRAIRPTLSQSNNVGVISGQILSPNTSDVISGDKVEIRAEAQSPDGIANVEFLAKHAGQWQKLGTIEKQPYTFVWDTSSLKKPYATTLTIHIRDKKGHNISDPGGWKEDIILTP